MQSNIIFKQTQRVKQISKNWKSRLIYSKNHVAILLNASISLLIAIGCDDSNQKTPEDIANSCITEDLIAQCPLGTSPSLNADANSECASNETITLTAEGERQAASVEETQSINQVCVRAGGCQLVCALNTPCEFGVKSITREQIICNDEEISSCGDGSCSGGETNETCPVDCNQICRPGVVRCNGILREVCNERGATWEVINCPAEQTCVEEPEGARCAYLPRCGNGVLEGNEGCDDGNVLTETCAYGEEQCQVCDAQCALVPGRGIEVCGDGVLNGPEQCDELSPPCEYGNAECMTCVGCQWVPGEREFCGDGLINGPMGAEICDEVSPPCEYGDAECVTCVGCQWVPGERELCGDGLINGAMGAEACDEISPPCQYGDAECVSCVACQWVPGERELCGDGVVNGAPGVEECDGQWYCDSECAFRSPCARSAIGCPDIQWIEIEGGEYRGEQINDFFISKKEITVSQYLMCVSAGACSLPYGETFQGLSDQGYAHKPITNISIRQYMAFLRWIGALIPREIEWQWAATSRNNDYIYPWGTIENTLGCDDVYIGYPECGIVEISDVCMFPNSNSAQGACDLIGNASEMVVAGDENCRQNTNCILSNVQLKGMSWRNYHLEPTMPVGVDWRYAFNDSALGLDIYNDLNPTANNFVAFDHAGIRPLMRTNDPTIIPDICADGFIGEGEQCEDGNLTTETCPYDHPGCIICDSQCQLIEGMPGACGDGYINLPEEQCDSQTICMNDCQLPPCAQSRACPTIEWIDIQGGEFVMGDYRATPLANATPIHTVSVNDFKIMKTKVTVANYMACVDAGACSAPRCGVNSILCNYILSNDNQPINHIYWLQAQNFASWVGGRLPSEAEWEFAARSRGGLNLYSWGDDYPNCSYANYGYCREGTTDVCAYPNSNTEQGLCDMSGNIYEWLMDEFHDNYEGAPVDGSPWCSGSCFPDAFNPIKTYVLRGGSWNGSAERLLNFYRIGIVGTSSGPNYGGFRLIKN